MGILIGMKRQDLEKALRPVGVEIGEERVEACCLYAKSDAAEAAWIVLDFMDFNLNVVKTVRNAVAAKTGIAREHVHILSTHNHGGGTPDLEVLADVVADAAVEAKTTARAAKMRAANATPENRVNYLRRIYVPELEGCTTYWFGVGDFEGFESFDAAPHIEHAINEVVKGNLAYFGTEPTERPYTPWPEADDLLTVVEFRGLEDDAPIGSLVRFAAHVNCDNGGGYLEGDFPYVLRQRMEEALGGNALFFTGPCGDVCPWMAKKRNGTSAKIGNHLADTALKALEGVPFEPVTKFADLTQPVDLPVRSEVLAGDVVIEGEMPENLPARRRYLEALRTKSSMDFLLEKYQEGEEGPLKETTEIQLGFLRLNDVIFAAFPGETFSTTGAALQAAYPNANITTVTEHWRTVMYLPPREDLANGSYEATCRVTDEGAAELLAEKSIEAMAKFLKA